MTTAHQKRPAMLDYDITVKTILIGDSSVGKSSLLYRYTDNDWNPYYIATIGVDFKVTTMERKNRVVKLQLWDTAGQERFRSITQSYYKGAHSVALVFDVNDRDSFESLRIWLNDVKNFGTTNVPIVLLGNKCDMNPQMRRVPEEEARQFASSHNIPYFETSAKTGANVQEAFEFLVDKCIEHRENNIVKIGQRNRDGIVIPRGRLQEEEDAKKSKFSCGCN